MARGRGRGRGHCEVAESSRTLPNGALEASFQVQVLAAEPPIEQPPIERAPRRRRTTRKTVANAEPSQAPELPSVTVNEPPAPPVHPRRRAASRDEVRASTQPEPAHVRPELHTRGPSLHQQHYVDPILGVDSEVPGAETGAQVPQVPITPDLENPFQDTVPSANTVPHPAQYSPPHVQFGEPSSAGYETFPSPSSSSGSEPSTPSRRPPPASRRSRGMPRIGRHSHVNFRREGPAGNKKSKGASDLWPFYVKRNHRHECILCQQKHAINPDFDITMFSLTTSTTGLRRHLADDHGDPWIQACEKLGVKITAKVAQGALRDYEKRKGKSTTGVPEPDPSGERIKYTPEAFVDAVMEFIVADDQSINVIESPQLRAIFLMLREELKDSDIPHRTTMRNRIMEVWEQHLDTLHDEMQDAIGKISLTMDLWSDPNLTPFMAVTAHWIEVTTIDTDEGPQYTLRLRADLIGFHRVLGRHDGEHLAHAFLYVLDRIGIAHLIGWITLDNASNNDTFMAKLEELLRQRDIPFHRVDRRIRCFPHVVNLACKAVLSAILKAYEGTGSEDPVTAVCSLVRVIRGSSIRRQYFSEIAKALLKKDLQLLRDVDTRWSSTMLMVERALVLRHAIRTFLSSQEFAELRKYQLPDHDWIQLEDYKDILAVPHAFQQRLSAEKTPTLCDYIPSFEALARVWRQNQEEHPETADIVQAGLDKLWVYQDRAQVVPVYVVAMILNPRMKLQFFSKYQPERVQWAKDLFLRELHPYYNAAHTNTAQPTPARPPRTPARRNAMPRNNVWADNILGLEPVNTASELRSLESEVDAYLLDSQRGTSSILFWQENQLRYPTLFAAVMDVLPIQGSAVPCERVFSSGKETTTPRRNRITPDLMEALQMLKFTLRNGRPLNFTAGISKDDELEELELAAEEQNLLPEDINQYVQTLQAVNDL